MLGQPPVEFDISSMDTFSIDFYHKMNVMETTDAAGQTGNYYGVTRLLNGSSILNWFEYDVNYEYPNQYKVQQPADTPSEWYGTTNVSTSIGKWKHIVLSHDKINNVIKYYINGTEVLSGTSYANISGIANWDKFQLEAYRRGGDLNSNSDFDYKYRFVPNAMLSPSQNLFGTGNDLPANFGEIVSNDGQTGINYWTYDPSDNTVIGVFIDTLYHNFHKMVKWDLNGSYVDNSSKSQWAGALNVPYNPTIASQSDLINYYNTANGQGNDYSFTKGTNFYGITFGDDDTLSWYSSLDLNTTNFWEYMNTYFVDTGIFALTGTNSIRWEGGANGTVRPDITINLEGGYVLNINTLWFVTDYTKGLYHRKDTGTGSSVWWIEDLSPGGLYQFQLYSYNSASVQQFNASFDVVGLTTQSYTFFMGTTTSPVVTDTIEADANGKIFINTMDNGPHGSSLAWIRIRAVGSEPPLHIDFSAYVDHSIEFAQADLTSKFSSVAPQFLAGATKDQATSSNSNFEYQQGSYTADAGGINFWHYTADNTPATFKCIADRDGKCIIVYGCLWTNESVKVYVNGSLHSETNFTSDITKISVSTGDVIEIQETQSVIGLYSITFIDGPPSFGSLIDGSPQNGTGVTNGNYNLASYFGQIGLGNSLTPYDVIYWAVDTDNTVILVTFQNTYYHYIKITLDGTYIIDSGKYEYLASSGQGSAPSSYSSQSEIISDYQGATAVNHATSARSFVKGSDFYTLMGLE